MLHISIRIVSAFYLLSGVYMLIAPAHWYEAVPGVTSTGPFNIHFVRDIGLVFIASAAALLWGAVQGVRSTAVAGAAWPCLHALFHVQIWLARGVPVDAVAAVNLAAIQLPAWLALWATLKLPRHQQVRNGRTEQC